MAEENYLGRKFPPSRLLVFMEVKARTGSHRCLEQRTKVSVLASKGLVSLHQTIHLVTFQPTLFGKEDSNLLGNCFMQAQSKSIR